MGQSRGMEGNPGVLKCHQGDLWGWQGEWREIQGLENVIKGICGAGKGNGRKPRGSKSSLRGSVGQARGMEGNPGVQKCHQEDLWGSQGEWRETHGF